MLATAGSVFAASSQESDTTHSNQERTMVCAQNGTCTEEAMYQSQNGDCTEEGTCLNDGTNQNNNESIHRHASTCVTATTTE